MNTGSFARGVGIARFIAHFIGDYCAVVTADSAARERRGPTARHSANAGSITHTANLCAHSKGKGAVQPICAHRHRWLRSGILSPGFRVAPRSRLGIWQRLLRALRRHWTLDLLCRHRLFPCGDRRFHGYRFESNDHNILQLSTSIAVAEQVATAIGRRGRAVRSDFEAALQIYAGGVDPLTA